MKQHDLKDQTAIWVRTEVLNSLREPSLPPKTSTRTRKIPTHGKKRSQNPQDWGWVFGYILANTTSSSHSRAKVTTNAKNSAGTTILIFDESSPFHNQKFTLTSSNAFVMANDHDSNESDENPPNDLIHLTHLHEPAVISCLTKRYAKDEIYTSTGPILLALNPFKRCPDLYSQEIVDLYSNSNSSSSMEQHHDRDQSGNNEYSHQLPPHVFEVADRAFQNMTNHQSETKHRNQSILVSGESGAGKTVTTKFVMQYLAKLSQKSQTKQHQIKKCGKSRTTNEGGIEQQVLQSNPILESFGNARTIRNDNSSRFGKFIEIHFQSSLHALHQSPFLKGASIKTYLLEKVRLITQAKGERNYHVFYEILSGASATERESYYLYDLTAEDFNLINSSGTYDRRDGVSDSSTYKDLREAMNTMGFTKDEQFNTLSVVCALLHASNITFEEYESEASQIEQSNPFVGATVTLLGVSAEDLNAALCSCAIKVAGERLMKNLSSHQASKALEAFIKATYATLFRFIVQAVNSSIAGKQNQSNESLDDDRDAIGCNFIGVLDIFGFESFTVNSFEQLCINYCNEALQQQFNKFIFKLEQQEYEREGIKWSFIKFPDNQDILDLIDKKHTGILSILDEQCRLAKCTDRSFATAIYEKCSMHQRFDASPTQRVSGLFSVNHYAGPVEYNSSSFLEKNKDELPKEATELLQSSSNPFLRMLAQLLANPSSSRSLTRNDDTLSCDSSVVSENRNKQRKSSSLSRASVGSQFATQLQDLRERINRTSPHYIRCLKPNDELIPDHFDSVIIADQLRCAGVLEAIRVSRVGYPQRYAHNSFFQRYRVLAPKELKKIPFYQKDSRCEVLVKAVAMQIRNQMDSSADIRKSVSHINLIEVGIQIGKSKVFLRQHAFDALETLRRYKVEESATKAQAWIRMFLSRKAFRRKLLSILFIQCCVRRFLAIKFVQNLRFLHAAVILQTFWRTIKNKNDFKCIRAISVWTQRHYRGSIGRRRFKFLNNKRKAIIIQKVWRKQVAVQGFWMKRRAVLIIQCFLRCRRAHRTLKELKKDAKNLNLVAKERDKLRQEAAQMRKELEETKRNAEKEIEEAKRNGEQTYVSFNTSNAYDSGLQDHHEVEVLLKEVDRLKNELAKSSNTEEQEKELVRLTQLCSEKDDEIEALKQELSSLRELNREFANGKVELNSSIDHRPHEKHDNHGSTHSLKKAFITRPSESSIDYENRVSKQEINNVISQDTEDGPAGSFVSNIFTPQKILSKLGPLNSLLGKTITNDEFSMIDGNQKGDVALKNSNHHSFERDEFYRDLNETSLLDDVSDVFERNSVCPSVLSSSFVDAEGNGTPLHYAILSLDHESLEYAIKKSSNIHMDINTGDNEGRTPLHLAALKSVPEMVSLLLENLAVTNSQDHYGNSPLHYAEDVNTIRILLNGGARPNIPNENGLCALHLAVQRRDILAVKILVDNGADVNTADNIRWYTPLHLIAQAETEASDQEIMQVGEYDSDKISIVQQISDYLCSDKVPLMPDVNSQDKDGNIPLHHSCILADFDAKHLINLFLEKGSDPNTRNNHGQTPLHLFCHNKALRRFPCYHDMLHLLLVSGSDPSASSKSGCTPLHLALYHRDIDAAVQLMQFGAQLHVEWKKPAHWETFWDEGASTETLASDMITDEGSLITILSSIQYTQLWAPSRPNCMQCGVTFGTFVRQHHCRHCGRIICAQCSPAFLDPKLFPTTFDKSDLVEKDSCRVCFVCEKILDERIDNARDFQPTIIPRGSSFEFEQSRPVVVDSK